MKITQEQINQAIENCKWKQKTCVVDICRGHVIPCSHAINNGQCDTLIKLFKEAEDGNDTNS